MSLIHLRPATLNPRVHYISPAFYPVQVERAAMERPAEKARPSPEKTSRSAALRAHYQRKRDRAPPSLLVQALCSRLNIRLQCGEILLTLWRANGKIVGFGDLGPARSSIYNAMTVTRRALPAGVEIRTEPNIGWFIPASARGPLTAIIERLAAENPA